MYIKICHYTFLYCTNRATSLNAKKFPPMALYPLISTTHNNFLVLEIREGGVILFFQSDSKPVRSAMKLSAVITPRGGLRFVAVLVMCCAILAHISAMDETQVEQRRGDEKNFNKVPADSAGTGKLKQSLMQRERRSANNATPNLSDIEKRLKAIMEDRCAFLVRKSFISVISVHLLAIYLYNIILLEDF